MHSTRGLPLITLAISIALGWGVAGTEPGTDPPAQAGASRPAPTFSVAAELVVLHVTVKDRQGRYVSGLPASAFEVLDGGTPQTISVFMHDDAPVTLGLIVDSSGSMRGARERLLFASSAFADSSHTDDELFGLTFNDEVYPALPPLAPFTNDAHVLGTALARVVAARGRTALYDGITRGLEYLDGGRHARKVLVLVSDGGDNASRATLEETIERAHASNAALYAVGVSDPLEGRGSRRILERLAALSGGVTYFPKDHRGLRQAMRDIARDVRQAYTLGFVPTGVARDGAVHRVRVSVSVPGQRFAVRARTGYLASGEAAAVDAVSPVR